MFLYGIEHEFVIDGKRFVLGKVIGSDLFILVEGTTIVFASVSRHLVLVQFRDMISAHANEVMEKGDV